MNEVLTPEVLTAPSAIESVQRAEVDVQITTAHRFPRQIGKVKTDMLSYATLDQETAEGCFYSLPRGGKTIQGPSVRLAEIATSCYGNMRVGSRVISSETKGDMPHVIVQAVAHDLEKNVAVTMEKRRRIVGKKSKGGQIDEDDINLAVNACAAIAFRDAVFKVVPLAFIKPVMEAAKRVAIGDARTLGDRRIKAIETFAKMGVTKDRVLAALEKASVEEIGLAELETLLGLHTAIREGAASIDDSFPPPAITLAGLKKQDDGPEPKPPTTAPAAAPEPPRILRRTPPPSTPPQATEPTEDDVNQPPEPPKSEPRLEVLPKAAEAPAEPKTDPNAVQEPPPPSEKPLTAKQQAAEDAVMAALGETPGSQDSDAWDWCAKKWPNLNWRKVETFNQVSEYVCGEIVKRAADLRKYIAAVTAARGGAK